MLLFYLQVKGVQSLNGSKTGAMRLFELFGSWNVRSSAACRSRELSRQLAEALVAECGD